jgi:probable HAF family extracellular repeat protein
MRRVLLIVMSLAVLAALGGRGVRNWVGSSGEAEIGGGQALGKNSQARGINGRGQVVGVSDRGSCYHAVLWEKGTMRDLGTLGGECSVATAINDRGQIVGWSYTGG